MGYLTMRFPALIVLSMLVAFPACADPGQDALLEVAKCVVVDDPGERLKCFDKAASLAKSALAATPKVADKKSWLDLFGFPTTQAPPKTTEEFGKVAPPPDSGEVKEVTANVLEFARTPRGPVVFILENGQVWRQLPGDTTVIRDPVPGAPMKVTIENGFLGSYNLSIEGRKGIIKVTRLK